MITLLQTIDGRLSTTTVSRDELYEHKGMPAKVSVIVPVYNAEHLLDATLESVKGQTLKDIEIICVNDASTDASLEVLEGHAATDARITVISNTCNSGTGTAINLGLSLANGDFVQYLGNDDLLEPNALEQLYDYCTDNDLDFCLYGIQVMNDNPDDEFLAQRALAKEDYHRVAHEYPITSGIELLRLAAQNGEYHMSNGPQIVRKALLDTNGIRNLEGIHHEDMYYTYRVLLSARRATLLTSTPYRYRIRHGSLETTKMERFHTAEEFTALLLSAAKMVEATPDELFFDPAFSRVIEREIDRYLGIAIRRYVAMPASERNRVPQPKQKIAANLLPIAKLYAQDIDQKCALLKKAEERVRESEERACQLQKTCASMEEELDELRRVHRLTETQLRELEQDHTATKGELSKLKQAHAKLKNSYSYRIGHAITAGPRYVKKAIKRVKAGKKSC